MPAGKRGIHSSTPSGTPCALYRRLRRRLRSLQGRAERSGRSICAGCTPVSHGPLNHRRPRCRLPARFVAVLRGIHGYAVGHTMPTFPFVPACLALHLRGAHGFAVVPTGHTLPYGAFGRARRCETPDKQRNSVSKKGLRRFPKGDHKALWSHPQVRNP